MHHHGGGSVKRPIPGRGFRHSQFNRPDKSVFRSRKETPVGMPDPKEDRLVYDPTNKRENKKGFWHEVKK